MSYILKGLLAGFRIFDDCSEFGKWFCYFDNSIPTPQSTHICQVYLSEAMEARAQQRAERRKEIEELKRKKEDKKLVSND